MTRARAAAAALVGALVLMVALVAYAGTPAWPRTLNTGKCAISPPVNEPAWTIPPMPAECY